MIIFPGGPDRSRNATRLPLAAPSAQRSADASRTGPSVPGAKRSRGFASRFDLVEFETDAQAHLDDLAADSSLDPDAYRRKAAADIGQMAEQRFDPAGDRALGAGTLPGYRQALDRLQGVTKELTEDLRVRDAAARVFDTTVRVLNLPDDGPADRLKLFERTVDAVDDLALTPDQKVQVRTAIAARVLSEGKADLLQGRLAGLKGPGERLLAELAEAQRQVPDAGQDPKDDGPDPSQTRRGHPTRGLAVSETPDNLSDLDPDAPFKAYFPEDLPRGVRDGLKVLTADERGTLEAAVGRLHDLGAPDEVVARTIADVTARTHGQRQTANPGVLVLGAVAVFALMAASLESQRRQGVQTGAGESLSRKFGEWNDHFRALANEQGGDEDTEDDRRHALEVPAPRSVTAEEPPPEFDPLIELTSQVLAGEIMKKGLEENPVFRENVDSIARKVVPKLRELFPDGLEEAELRRVLLLGREPEGSDYRPDEVVTGVLLERVLGMRLQRSQHVGEDWIDPMLSTTYDGVLGNMPQKHYTIERAKEGIQDHVRKSIEKIVVDLHHLTELQAAEVKDYINTELPTDVFKRIIIVE